MNWTNYEDLKTEKSALDMYNMTKKTGITTALSEGLGKKCETEGLVTQIFLASIPSELSIKDEKITMSKKDSKFPIILSIRCSADGRKYISAAKNKNELVVADCRHEKATKLLKKIPKLNNSASVDYIFYLDSWTLHIYIHYCRQRFHTTLLVWQSYPYLDQEITKLINSITHFGRNGGCEDE